MAKNRFNIAVIAGDGIGKEVVPEGLRVLEAVAARFGINLHYDHFDFSSYDYYAKHGDMLPEDWKDQIGGHDAIFFGAVGLPDKIPDHISLWGSLLKFRREFDQYVNLRPVRLLPGVPSPLAGRVPGDIDFYIVRENTEGEYSSIGGRMFAGTEREVVIQETVMSRIGVESVPIALFISMFTGVVLALQASYTLTGQVPLYFVGALVGKTMILELGPVLTGLALSGRVGANIAAEIGTMRVTEQIDALETLAYDPVAYLVTPRVLAGAIMFPMVVILSIAIGIAVDDSIHYVSHFRRHRAEGLDLVEAIRLLICRALIILNIFLLHFLH